MRKKILFIIFSVFISQISVSQATLSAVKSIAMPYETVELRPEFPGGLNEFLKYVAENFKPNTEEELSGEIIVSFIIEGDGSISEVKVLKDIGRGTGNEAKRVVSNSPKWIPGKNLGKPARVQFVFPIKIRG
jgi:hypothetical protein